MPRPALIDPTTLDSSRLLYTREQIYELLPQRYEFAQLDGVLHLDKATGLFAGLRNVKPDEWWCRGHMPGHPLFPGMLMMECAAQLAAFAQHHLFAMEGAFLGFGGVDDAKFRDSVIPPAKIILIGKLIEARSRRFVCDLQAFNGSALVFEGRITGVPIRADTPA